MRLASTRSHLGGVHLAPAASPAGSRVARGRRLRRAPARACADELVHVPELSVRLDGSGLEPGQVEQLPDDAVEARGLAADRLRERRVGPRARARARGSQARRPTRGSLSSGERRSCETARSSAVLRASLRRRASASSASRLEPAALGDDREQGGERRQEAAPDRLVDRRLLVHEERRDAPQPRFDGQGLLALLRRLLAELQSCALDTEHARRERREPPQLLVEVRPRSRSSAASASACASARRCSASSRSRPRPRRERAHGERDGEVDGEREPVLALRRWKRVFWLQEEPVEDEHAGDGDDRGERRSPEDRDGQDGEHVERAQAQHRDVGLEQCDDRAHDRTTARGAAASTPTRSSARVLARETVLRRPAARRSGPASGRASRSEREQGSRSRPST